MLGKLTTININEMSIELKKEEMGIEFLRIFAKFNEEIVRELYFHTDSLKKSIVSFLVCKEFREMPIFLSEANIDYNEFRIRSKDDNGNGDYIQLLHEKIYSDYYQLLEIYLAEVFKCLYWFFPLALADDTNPRKLSNVYFDDLFGKIDILAVRQRLVENKVKDLIQTGNIIKSIGKLKGLFGVDAGVCKEDLDRLFIYAQKRHLFVHDRGLVNRKYLNNIGNNGLTADSQIGERLQLTSEDVNDMGNFILEKIGRIIHNTLTLKIEDLFLNYEKRYLKRSVRGSKVTDSP